MLQAFIVTLREGVEASLIVGIVFAYLSKIGRPDLKKTVFWALGSAIAASVLCWACKSFASENFRRGET